MLAQPLSTGHSPVRLIYKWSYDYPMEYQQLLLQFRDSSDSESASQKDVGIPLNQEAKKLYRNKEWLEQRYVKEQLSTYKIAEIYKIPSTTIYRNLKKLNISTRPHGKTGKFKDKRWLKDKYIQEELSQEKIGLICDVSRKCITYWLNQFNISIRSKSQANIVRYKTHKSGNYKQGRIKDIHDGYIRVLKPNHPYASKKGYILEHRWIMEQQLNRLLKPMEVVHHKNNIRDDNKIENLELFKSQSKHISYHMKGKNHPNWQGGISFESYGKEFNRKLKKDIRQRDNYLCQLCFKHNDNLIKELAIHHIDYDKTNNIPSNLVSLCNKCHAKTVSNRNYWIEYFKKRVFP